MNDPTTAGRQEHGQLQHVIVSFHGLGGFRVDACIQPGAPARFQASVGKHFWRKFYAKRRIFFSLPTLVFSLPALYLKTWVGKDPPAITYM